MNKMQNWKTVSSKSAYKNKWFEIRQDEVIKPNGKPGEYFVFEKRDFVVVIAKLNDKFIMVEQERYPVQSMSLEFSMGVSEEGESPEEAALREFEEETGYKANNLTFLGSLWLAPGYSSQSYHVFVAEDFSSGKIKLDESEADLKTRELTEEEFKDAVISGQIKDATTIASYNLYLLKGEAN